MGPFQDCIESTERPYPRLRGPVTLTQAGSVSFSLSEDEFVAQRLKLHTWKNSLIFQHFEVNLLMNKMIQDKGCLAVIASQ